MRLLKIMAVIAILACFWPILSVYAAHYAFEWPTKTAIRLFTLSTDAGHIIRDEGMDLPQRQALDFVGAGVTASDVAGVTRVTIPGASGGASTADHFLITQTDAELTNAFNLGGLGSGIIKQTVVAGVSTPSIASAGTDYQGVIDQTVDVTAKSLTLGKNGVGGTAAVLTLRDGANPGTTTTITGGVGTNTFTGQILSAKDPMIIHTATTNLSHYLLGWNNSTNGQYAMVYTKNAGGDGDSQIFFNWGGAAQQRFYGDGTTWTKKFTMSTTNSDGPYFNIYDQNPVLVFGIDTNTKVASMYGTFALGKNGASGIASVITMRDGANPGTTTTITGTATGVTFNNNITVTGHAILEGVTPTGATGTGNLVFSASPTFTGTVTVPNTVFISGQKFSKSFCITNPTASKYFPVWRCPVNAHITAVHLLCKGNVVVGQLWIFDTSGLNGSAVDASDITGVVDSSIDDDGSLSAPAVTAGKYVGVHHTSVTGTPTYAYWTFEGYFD